MLSTTVTANDEDEFKSLTVEQYVSMKEELRDLRAEASVSRQKARALQNQVLQLKKENEKLRALLRKCLAENTALRKATDLVVKS